MVETIANPAYEALARRFKRFADTQYRGESPLYEHLALAIAADHELLALAAHAAQGQPVPNLLLAAVHFLLLKGQADPLAQFYPNLTSPPSPPDAAYPAFRAFCLAQAAAIRHLLATRRVQTNEVGRCAYLSPTFTLVATLAHERPLAQIEIGTSAGLNLLWDRYGYHYGQDAVYGDHCSSVQIACTLRGHTRPPLPDRMPAVCVFHTYTINQFSAEARDRLSAVLAEYEARRDIYRLSAEWMGAPHPQLELTAWQTGQAHHRLLAYCDHHGRWPEWLDCSRG
jgi:hypothetical protein